MNNKIIIGLAGELSSGKDTVADYLKEKYSSETISFSKILRDILDRLYLPQTRENMVNLSEILRKRFGQKILANVIAKEIEESDSEMFILPNIRRHEDLLDMPGFNLVRLDADPKIRYERLIKRTQNPDDQTKTWEQFLEDSELPTEITIRDVAKKAKYELNNNGDFDALYDQVEKLITKIKNE